MKAIKEIGMAVGVMVFLVGLIVCSCEQPTLAEQVRTFAIGGVVMVIGAAVTWLASRGCEDVYTG